MRTHRHAGKYRSGTPRGRIVYKRKPIHKHKFPKRHRRIFQRLDQEPIETGGSMDFNDQGLERADVYMGRRDSVDIGYNPDDEVTYHTHPSTGNIRTDKMNFFPSKDDVYVARDLPSQSMLIFHKGQVTVATKGKKFKPDPKRLNQIEKGLQKDAGKMSVDRLFKKYIPEYKKMGLQLKHVKHKGAFKIPMGITEPVERKKVTHRGFFDGEPISEEENIRFAEENVRRAKEERELKQNVTNLLDEREREEVRQLAFEQAAEETERESERHRAELRGKIEAAKREPEFTTFGEEEDPRTIHTFRRRK